jgi:hypothetical protein
MNVKGDAPQAQKYDGVRGGLFPAPRPGGKNKVSQDEESIRFVTTVP